MSVEKLYRDTKQLIQLLENPVPKEDRDDYIANIEQMLESREQLMDKLNPPYTEEEMRLGKELIDDQKIIDEKFKMIKSQIQTDLNQLSKTKESNNKYTNPYQSLSNGDGMFFDRKK
ncbi:hypothetical protein [Litchfieldia salsa]|uniref:Flagellar protein FliT n=1 Tax=Litchfieldia salsa TaxID=930152 RepID=A0A1H0WDB0_9BACI|nr:hypothetical protein [Litchfieldia salsa]SDP88694.1 flagellar protein FliT [Litchfieldia salsa]